MALREFAISTCQLNHREPKNIRARKARYERRKGAGAERGRSPPRRKVPCRTTAPTASSTAHTALAKIDPRFPALARIGMAMNGRLRTTKVAIGALRRADEPRPRLRPRYCARNAKPVSAIAKIVIG